MCNYCGEWIIVLKKEQEIMPNSTHFYLLLFFNKTIEFFPSYSEDKQRKVVTLRALELGLMWLKLPTP